MVQSLWREGALCGVDHSTSSAEYPYGGRDLPGCAAWTPQRDPGFTHLMTRVRYASRTDPDAGYLSGWMTLTDSDTARCLRRPRGSRGIVGIGLPLTNDSEAASGRTIGCRDSRDRAVGGFRYHDGTGLRQVHGMGAVGQPTQRRP
jgi:hypothetical protein